MSPLSPPLQRFVDYFGDLGPRWGLDRHACRVHALLYVWGRPAGEAELAEALSLRPEAAAEALAYLAGFAMAAQTPDGWRSGADPWEMLLAGLQERRRRELAPALETLRACQAEALRGPGDERHAGERIGRVVTLVEDLAALELQASRLSPRMLRSLVGMGGRAARFLERGRREGK